MFPAPRIFVNAIKTHFKFKNEHQDNQQKQVMHIATKITNIKMNSTKQNSTKNTTAKPNEHTQKETPLN